MNESHYSVLSIGEGATRDEVKAAFRKKAKEHHPDANGGSEESAARFRKVKSAYDVLSDPTRRREYDHQLRRERLDERVRALAAKARATAVRARQSRRPTSSPYAVRSARARPSGDPGAAVGTAAVGFAIGAVLAAVLGSDSRWDPKVKRYRGSDGRFTSR